MLIKNMFTTEQRLVYKAIETGGTVEDTPKAPAEAPKPDSREIKAIQGDVKKAAEENVPAKETVVKKADNKPKVLPLGGKTPEAARKILPKAKSKNIFGRLGAGIKNTAKGIGGLGLKALRGTVNFGGNIVNGVRGAAKDGSSRSKESASKLYKTLDEYVPFLDVAVIPFRLTKRVLIDWPLSILSGAVDMVKNPFKDFSKHSGLSGWVDTKIKSPLANFKNKIFPKK